MSDWVLSPAHAALVKTVVEQFNRQHPPAFREQISAYVKEPQT
jgi:hypothetical protein